MPTRPKAHVMNQRNLTYQIMIYCKNTNAYHNTRNSSF